MAAIMRQLWLVVALLVAGCTSAPDPSSGDDQRAPPEGSEDRTRSRYGWELSYNEITLAGPVRSGNWSEFNEREPREGAMLTYFVNASLPCPFEVVLEVHHNDTAVATATGAAPLVVEVPLEVGVYSYALGFADATGSCRLRTSVHYSALMTAEEIAAVEAAGPSKGSARSL